MGASPPSGSSSPLSDEKQQAVLRKDAAGTPADGLSDPDIELSDEEKAKAVCFMAKLLISV